MMQIQIALALTLVGLTLCGASTVVIEVDTSAAPDLYDFGYRVKQALEHWFPFIADILLTQPGFNPPTVIPIYFDPDYDGIAYASNGRIVGSVNYYRTHQDDVGSMIHEMCHVIQMYPAGCPWYYTEGVADYVRYFYYEPNRKPNKPTPAQNYTSGYGVTAYFLDYVVENVRVDIVYHLNRDCRQANYDESIWSRLTGKSANLLWQDMMMTSTL